jgi:hypothetical protein
MLISFVIYDFSYWTVQVAPSDGEARSVRLLNQMGRDLESTGMSKVARAIDPMPEIYFQDRRPRRIALSKSAIEPSGWRIIRR